MACLRNVGSSHTFGVFEKLASEVVVDLSLEEKSSVSAEPVRQFHCAPGRSAGAW